MSMLLFSWKSLGQCCETPSDYEDDLGISSVAVCIETPVADSRLARHYFFTGDYITFNSIFNQIPAKFGLAGDELENHQNLGEVLGIVYEDLSTGKKTNDLSQGVLEDLESWGTDCSEAGVIARILLRRNSLEFEPDCSTANKGSLSTKPTKVDKKTLLAAFPNPSDDYLTIKISSQILSGKIRLLDMSGKVWRQCDADSPQKRISTQTLPTGVYLLELSQKNQSSETIRIAITH